MADEAARRAKELGVEDAEFYTSDLESVTGKYDTVTCVDVAIHYPTEKMSEMIGHLCSLERPGLAELCSQDMVLRGSEKGGGALSGTLQNHPGLPPRRRIRPTSPYQGRL